MIRSFVDFRTPLPHHPKITLLGNTLTSFLHRSKTASTSENQLFLTFPSIKGLLNQRQNDPSVTLYRRSVLTTIEAETCLWRKHKFEMSIKLPTRAMGRNGPQIPALGFGLMGLSCRLRMINLVDSDKAHISTTLSILRSTCIRRGAL